MNRAKSWAKVNGFEDGIFWLNTQGDNIVDVLTRYTVLADEPEFVQAVITDGLDVDTFVGYEFDDGSLIVLAGDVWMVFDPSGESEDGDYQITEIRDD